MGKVHFDPMWCRDWLVTRCRFFARVEIHIF
jgi:hypothetical protein